MKNNKIELKGKVIEVLPNNFFRVKLQNGDLVTAKIANNCSQEANFLKKKRRIRVVEGDEVKLAIPLDQSSKDKIKGQIIHVFNQVSF